jgi:hypothetical protein
MKYSIKTCYTLSKYCNDPNVVNCPNIVNDPNVYNDHNIVYSPKVHLKMYNVSNNPLISILYTPIINTNQIKIIQ